MFSPFRWLVLDRREPSDRAVKAAWIVVGIVVGLAILALVVGEIVY